MFFTLEKLKSRILELNQYRYLEVESLEFILKQGAEEEVFKVGQVWEGRDTYLTLTTKVQLPIFSEAQRLLFFFDFGRTGGGNNSGFESLLLIDGVMYQGVDSNHQEVFISQELSGQLIHLELRLWSGLEGGGPPKIQQHLLKKASLLELEQATDDLYYTADVLVKTIEQLPETNPDKHSLLSLLNRGGNLINWTLPGSSHFYESVQLANAYIQDEIAKLEKNSSVSVYAVGHTHIDVAWLWRLKHTREKAGRSFATVLRLMADYPDYLFLQTQPQLYEYVKEDYPELYERIKAKIQEGRWEVDGGMWLEADCNIPSGESLVRQILMGSAFIKKEFNQEVNYLWLPDVFGYSWALPQILVKSGIKTFMTTKISWSQYNRMPHDTFHWKGIDGSEILTHFITTPDISGQDEGLHYYTYNGTIEPNTIKGIYDNYQDKKINSDLLLAYGYGDGGGGPTRDMLEKITRINQLPGMPTIKASSATDYFNKLHETIETTQEYVHTWDGELYLEFHRGTYTSQAFVKKMNRQLELLYRELEIKTSLFVTAKERMVLKQQLDQGWKIILRNQFHDIIPGSSINEVYQDVRLDYQEAFEIAKTIDRCLEATIVVDDNCYSIFNSAGWSRSDYLTINETREGQFFDEFGREIPTVRVTDGYTLYLEEVPALASQPITFVEQSLGCVKAISNFEFDERKRQATTPFYHITWDEKGQIETLYDRQHQRPVLAGKGNYFTLHEDKPLNYDAWDIDLFYLEKTMDPTFLQIELLELNQFSLIIGQSFKFNQSTIYQKIIFYHDNRRIDFETEVDWHERQVLLKVGFDLAIRTTEATFDIQYGNVKRPTHYNTSWDMARFESVGHQWADMSEARYGVSLLNDCKYGYDVKDNRLGLSLLKGAIFPDPEADVGKHQFTYALYPHAEAVHNSDVQETAWSLNSPLTAILGKLPVTNQFRIESAEVVVIDAIKPSEDEKGIILRLHEHLGARRKVTIHLDFPVAYWYQTNLLEKQESVRNETSVINLELTPFSIETIFIKVN